MTAEEAKEWKGGELLFAGGTDFFAVRSIYKLMKRLWSSAGASALG